MAKYDIYWVVLHFADKPNITARKPVVQIKDNPEEKGAFAIITSKGYKYKGKPHVINIDNLTGTGLWEPDSVIRYNRRLLNNPTKKKAGRLCKETIRAIELHEAVSDVEIEYKMAEEFDDEFTITSMMTEANDD